MNIQQLRQSLKLKWVSYYYNNRSWLEKMRVWGTYDGLRRPTSSFILATLSVLEPQLEEIFPFILELNNDPDQIVAALGLHFNPEEQLHLVELANCEAEKELETEFLHQVLIEQKPLAPRVVVTEVENNTQPVASVGVTTEVPFQTLSECKPLPVSTIANEQGQSQLVQSMAVATTEEVKSKSNPGSLVEFFSPEVESKSQSLSSIAFATQIQSKSNPGSLVAVITREVESQAVQSVSLATKVESKGRLMTTPQDMHNKLKPPLGSTSRTNLANWIDSFCQGVGWEKEDTHFIP
jgi:hypothetical protein